MKEGTQINTRRFILSKNVLKQLGYDENALTVLKYSRKAVWENKECVGCDKCVFICPYAAIKVDSFSSPRVIRGLRRLRRLSTGFVLIMRSVKGYEFENVLNRYADSAAKLKAQTNKPAILVFACQWAEYPGLDDPNSILKAKTP